MGGTTNCAARLLLLAAAAALQVAAFGEMNEEVTVQQPVGDSGLCIRLLNGTHQFGCTSSLSGDEGVIVVAESRADVEGARNGWKERFPDYLGGFVVLMDELLLDSYTAPLLQSSPRVAGLLLIPNSDDAAVKRTAPLSAEAACPNQASSLYSDWRACGASAADAARPDGQWNGKGAMLQEGMRFTDWAKPMMRVTNEQTVKMMQKCHDQYNLPSEEAAGEGRSGRLCAVALKLSMQAHGSSVECMRRQEPGVLAMAAVENLHLLCDSMTEKNVFAVLPPVVQKKKEEGEETNSSYLAIITRMDGISMVPTASPAVIGTMSALVTALTAAKVYGDNRALFEAAANRTNRRIVFAFLNGEAFDYVGSGRWVHDMEMGEFPKKKSGTTPDATPETISLDKIALAIELQQIDDSTSKSFFGHVDGKSWQTDEKKRIDRGIEVMKNATAPLGYNIHSKAMEKGVLPPSSLHSLLKRRRQMPALLLTSFDTQYRNRRLHSPYDRLLDGKTEEEAVKKAIEAAAVGVVALAADHVGIEPKTARERLNVDQEWLSKLSTCLLATTKFPSCDFFRQLFNTTMKDRERSSYVGAELNSLVRMSAFALMVAATGEHESTKNVRDSASCAELKQNEGEYTYYWQHDPALNDTFCYRTSVTQMAAASPAFIRDSEGQQPIAGSNYSTWVESRYALDLDYRLFLVESTPADMTLVLVGLITTLLAILIVGRFDDSSFIVDEGERAAEEGEPL